jgi:outer membrane protein TolC
MKQFILALPLALLFVPLPCPALTLEEGLKAVTENGRDVRIAQSDETVARETVSLARSPWLPSVDLYGRETWLRYQPASKLPFSVPGAGNSIVMSQDQFLTYGVRATQMLYDFGKTSSSVGAANFGLKAREIETVRVRNQSALDFIVSYLDLLESEKLLHVAGEEVTRYEAHRKDAEARLKAGVITRNEVLQSEVTLADSRQRLLTAEDLRSLKASKINSLLLKPLNDPVQADEVRPSPATGVTLEAAWTAAEAESSDLRNLDAKIAAKGESVRTIEAEYLPTFYLSGGYEYQENKYMVHQDNWSLIAGVNVNLFSGGASRSRAGMANSELRSLKLIREKMLDTVRLSVKAAYLDQQTSRQKVEVANTAVAAAVENLRLQKLRFEQGVGTTTEVLDAVTLLSTAESNLWRATYATQRAEANLLYSMGKDLVTAYGQ